MDPPLELMQIQRKELGPATDITYAWLDPRIGYR